MLRILRREKPPGLGAITAVEVVDALTVIRSTNAAFNLEMCY